MLELVIYRVPDFIQRFKNSKANFSSRTKELVVQYFRISNLSLFTTLTLKGQTYTCFCFCFVLVLYRVSDFKHLLNIKKR